MRASTRDRVRAGQTYDIRSFVQDIQYNDVHPVPTFGLSNDTSEFGLIRGSEARSNPEG